MMGWRRAGLSLQFERCYLSGNCRLCFLRGFLNEGFLYFAFQELSKTEKVLQQISAWQSYRTFSSRADFWSNVLTG
jgi:hypothetical protein